MILEAKSQFNFGKLWNTFLNLKLQTKSASVLSEKLIKININ